MKQSDLPYGVDFVLFDGEELVYDEDRDPYFLGSRYFAQVYAKQPPDYHYRAALLLDMIGDADLQIFQERQCAAGAIVASSWTASGTRRGAWE